MRIAILLIVRNTLTQIQFDSWYTDATKKKREIRSTIKAATRSFWTRIKHAHTHKVEWLAEATRPTMQHKTDAEHKQKLKCIQYRSSIDCVTNNHITLLFLGSFAHLCIVHLFGKHLVNATLFLLFLCFS